MGHVPTLTAGRVQIALDRLAYGPAFNLLMMSFVYKVSGQNWKQVWASLQKTFLSAQVLNWKMWPVAQYVNFNFIPPELQLLYMNVVALFWTIGLSMIMN
jgi:protein Mpv17